MSEPAHRATCRTAMEEPTPGTTYTVEDPLARRTWTDGDGVVWRRRGDGVLAPRACRRLLGRPGVLVAHVYHGPLELRAADGRAMAVVRERC